MSGACQDMCTWPPHFFAHPCLPASQHESDEAMRAAFEWNVKQATDSAQQVSDMSIIDNGPDTRVLNLQRAS